MRYNNNFIFDNNEVSKIIETINSIKKNTKEKPDFFKKIYGKYISYKEICGYGAIIYFSDIFIIKYFDKFFIFNGSIGHDEIKKFFSNSKQIKQYIHDKAIGLILNNKLLPDDDFCNLKKCYMLSENIFFNDKGEICCKYSPYYLIELELVNKTLTIKIDVTKSICELNMKNVEYDLKTFLIKVLGDMDESELKIHHQILQYYASLNDF